jgi:NAD(P)H dehydrogenase (quinone)
VNVLIICAHTEPKSFNGAMKDVAVETLRDQGHHVEVSDLYAMGFVAQQR